MKRLVAVLVLLVPLPARAAHSPEVSIERFYSLPHLIGTAPSGVVWSTDSRSLAFLWNAAGYDFKDVYLLDPSNEATRAPVRLTNLSESPTPPEGDPGVTDVRFHPDGTRLLFERGEELFLLTPGGGGDPIRVASGSTGRFSRDGLSLAFLRRGNLFVRELDSEAEPRLLAGDPRPEVAVESFEWAPDGRSIAFVEVDERRVPLRGIPDYLKPEVELEPVRRPFPGEEPASRRIGVVGLDGGAQPRFFALGGAPVDPIFSCRWSPDGRLLVDTSDLYVESRRLLVVEPWSGAVHEIHREEDRGNVTADWQAEWAPDGTAVYFLSDRDDDYHVYSVSATGGTLRRITSGDFAVSELAVTPEGLVFVANSPRPEERQVFRVGFEGGEPVRISRGAGTHEPSVSPDGKLVADIFSSDSAPPDLFLAAGDETSETRLTHSPLPEFDGYSWASPEYVTFASEGDGGTLYGRLLASPELDRTKKHPAIIGSIYSNSVRNQWGGRNAHPLWGLERVLLEKGYVLFNIDIRGSWGHGKAFRRAIRLDYGGVDVEDIASGRKYLASLPFVDPERIGIWGSSYGGLLTTMSLFKKPGLFQAGVAGAPATNVFHALTGEMRVMGPPQDHPAEYEAASPYAHAEGLRDPLLIIHGMRDCIVLYKDSVVLVDHLIRLGKNVDFVTLPGAEHGWDLGDLAQTGFAYHKLIEFFDRHLQEQTHD